MTAVRVRLRAALIAALLALPWLLSGCDNPSCVFSGDCGSGSAGSLGTNPAQLPPDGTWVRAGAPTLTTFSPGGTMIASTTPIVLRFSESMLAGTLGGAFEVRQTSGAGGGMVPLAGVSTVADGRLVVLLPSTALTNGQSYEVSLADTAEVTDLTGTLFEPADPVLGTFTVAATDPTAPRVVATWPVNGSTGASTTTEVVAVFDRTLNLGTVSATSFRVRVDSNAPTFNPAPTALTLVGSGGSVVSDSRVLRWRSVDSSNEAVYLGRGLDGELTISPGTNANDTIRTSGGTAVGTVTVTWDFNSIDAPVSARIASDPDDAIGIASLDGTDPLEVEVTLVDGQVGDTLTTLVFGTLPDTNPSRLGARQRTYSLTVAGTLVTLTEAELDLASSTAPVTARFDDGPLAFAFSLTRGGATTPVRRLDVDPSAAGLQDPLLDVTAPSLQGFGLSGTNVLTFTSDGRDLTLNGRADEALRSLVVTTAMGDNAPMPPVVGDGAGGLLPPVVGAREAGSFVARPVPLGLLDPGAGPLAFDATAYDRALNPAPPVSATFTQVGTVRDSSAVPAGMLEVHAFDAGTLLPIAGAVAYVHQDGGGGNLTFSNSAPADVTGSALLMDPGGTLVVTVDAAGYDLFTLHGVVTNRISVPLVPTGTTSAFLQGAVETPSTQLGTLDRRLGDARYRRGDERLGIVNACTFDAGSGLFSCSFGPLPVVPERLGALGFVAVSVPADVMFWSHLTFLRAAAFVAPSPAIAPALVGTETVPVAGLLNAAGADPEELPIDGPQPVLNASAAALGLGTLDGDPGIVVEARVPGVPGTVPVGAGVAFAAGANAWDVRCAYPGAADFLPAVGQLGSLVTTGAIEQELLLRAEVRDTLGAVAGARPTVSSAPVSLQPLAIPLVQPPLCTMAPGLCGGSSGAPPYAISFGDVISGTPGIYRVDLTGPLGRGWTIWRADGGGATASVGVPADAAGNPFLPDGTIACEVSAYAWPGFVPTSFAWTDVERRHAGFAHASPIQYAQP